jgi:hypothetical protein
VFTLLEVLGIQPALGDILIAMNFHKTWIEQCKATQAIRERFGVEYALEYLKYFHLLCSVFGAKKEALAIGGGDRVKGGFSRLQQCLFRARSVAA